MSEVIFHHVWSFKSDMINIAPLFNIHPKKRGKYDDENLKDTDLSTIKLRQQSKDAQLQETLFSYLQSQGIRYRSREGNFNVNDTHHLLPLLDDVVLTIINKNRHLAKITDLNTGIEIVVRVRTLYYGTQQEMERHICTLPLLQRKSDWSHGIPLDPTELPLDHGHNILHPEVDQPLEEDLQ